MDGKSKIFVDGNCAVCDYEIAHYKLIEAPVIRSAAKVGYGIFACVRPLLPKKR